MQTQRFPTKKSLKIDELSRELGVKKFIIKNWEKQFELKKCGPDNKYSQEDFKIFAAIKNLIFVQKVPQNLVKKHLQDILDGNYVKVITSTVCTDQENQATSEQELSSKATECNETLENNSLAESQETNIEDPAEIIQAEGEPQSIQLESSEAQAERQVIEEEFIEAETQTPTYQCAQTETICQSNTDIIAATETESMQIVETSFKEREDFLNKIQSFKIELLKIHEQLK